MPSSGGATIQRSHHLRLRALGRDPKPRELGFNADLRGASPGKPLDKIGPRTLNQGKIFFDDVRSRASLSGAIRSSLGSNFRRRIVQARATDEGERDGEDDERE